MMTYINMTDCWLTLIWQNDDLHYNSCSYGRVNAYEISGITQYILKVIGLGEILSHTHYLVYVLLYWLLHLHYVDYYIFIILTATSLLCWLLHLYYINCYIFIILTVTSLLFWLLHLYYVDCSIFKMLSVISLLYWLLHLYYINCYIFII
jgi:hypothetical protein